MGGVTYDFEVNHEWYVATTGNNANFGVKSAPFATIQHAIDVAAAGDTIIVADGTYNYLTEGLPVPAGLIKVSKPLTIRAAIDGNTVRPVIDGSGFDGIFKIWHSTFSGGEIIIEGFDLVGRSRDRYSNHCCHV